MKLWLAYWPSPWQAATDKETVIDAVFGVFSSKEKAEKAVKANLNQQDWEAFHEQFTFAELELDQYQTIPS